MTEMPNIDNFSRQLVDIWTKFTNEAGSIPESLNFPNVEVLTPERDVVITLNGERILDIHPNSDRRIYMASSVKLPYVFALLNLFLLPKGINANQPVDFIDKDVAEALMAELNRTDTTELDALAEACKPLLVENFMQLQPEDQMNELMKLQFTPGQIIEMTLGPSSNLTIVAIRNLLARELFNRDLKSTANAVADLLNRRANELSGRGDAALAITRSDLADEHGFNTAKFDDLAILIQDCMNQINAGRGGDLGGEDYVQTMRGALASVVPNPDVTNHSHEIKVILNKEGINLPVMEKSGYFFYPYKVGEGRVSINSFAQVEINGQRVDISYSVELPYKTDLDPSSQQFAEFVNEAYNIVVEVLTNAVVGFTKTTL